MQVLTEPLIVRKQEGLILLDRAADRGPELVPLKRRSGSHIEKVGSIEGIIPQIFKDRTVPLVRPRTA